MTEDIKTKFESLSNDVREAISSSDSATKLQEIGTEKGLHVDQIGILEEETMLVMLGVSHPDDFVDRIEDRLGISTEKAIEVATAVNVQIFLPVRESLMKMHEAPTEETSTETVHESKEAILAEIEQPTPRQNASSQGDHDTAHDFISATLSGNVTSPAQKKEVEVKKMPEKPKTYATDPYREQIS